MTGRGAGPLSRRVPLHRISPAGIDAQVEATDAERADLATVLDLPAIHRLEGRFRLVGHPDRVTVTGRVSASVAQTCGVTLEPFAVEIDEEVDIVFAVLDPRQRAPAPEELELSMEQDPPEELVGDSIDVGAIVAEHLALGLDPFPRKPGVVFEEPDPETDGTSPFARLASLRPKREGD